MRSNLKTPLFIVLGGIAFLSALLGCAHRHAYITDDMYSNHVGDISRNGGLDDDHFQRCFAEDSTVQYFNYSDGFRYKGEKKALNDFFYENYQPVHKKNQSGYIRIRFVVNCKGESGQFRVLESDEHFLPKKFHPKIVNQLLRLTKKLDGWFIVSDGTHRALDYYQYLIFKIEAGEIKEIMP